MNLIQKLARLESKLSRIDLKMGCYSCKLIFQVPTGTIKVDPATGCEYQDDSNYPIEITAFLEQSKRQTRNLEDTEVPGSQNSSSILMEGYLIDPVFLPTAVRPGMIADLIVGDPNNSFENGFYPMIGKFLLLPSLQSSDTIANHDIRGYAQFSPGAYSKTLSDAYVSPHSDPYAWPLPTFPPLDQWDTTFD